VDFFPWLSVKTWQPLYEPRAKRTFLEVMSTAERCWESGQGLSAKRQPLGQEVSRLKFAPFQDASSNHS
jgi:hypothetical protein